MECYFSTITAVCIGCHARGKEHLLNPEYLDVHVLALGPISHISLQ